MKMGSRQFFGLSHFRCCFPASPVATSRPTVPTDAGETPSRVEVSAAFDPPVPSVTVNVCGEVAQPGIALGGVDTKRTTATWWTLEWWVRSEGEQVGWSVGWLVGFGDGWVMLGYVELVGSWEDQWLVW